MKILKLTLCLFILFLNGCAFFSNPEGVSTLSALADNKRQTEEYLRQQEKLFYKLESDLKNNRLKKGMSQKAIVVEYGEPISIRPQGKLQNAAVFIYRHPTRYFSSDFVYLNFDENRLLYSWELIPAEETK